MSLRLPIRKFHRWSIECRSSLCNHWRLRPKTRIWRSNRYKWELKTIFPKMWLISLTVIHDKLWRSPIYLYQSIFDRTSILNRNVRLDPSQNKKLVSTKLWQQLRIKEYSYFVHYRYSIHWLYIGSCKTRIK